MTAEVMFSPFQLNGLEIPNRFVMAPMTRSFARDMVLPAESAAYYRRRAEGGVGLILTELAVVDRPVSYSDPGIPGFWGEESLAAWKHVVDEVHSLGGLIALQLGHVGNNANPFNGWLPEGEPDSPSGIDNLGRPVGKPMTERDIFDTVQCFSRAAASAKAMGFDAIEIHGGHGGLIDQFYWDYTNRRSDRWGGSVRGRATFGADVIKAVRNAVGHAFPLITRISQWKMNNYDAKIARTPSEMAEWLEPLVDAGVDAFHCSQRRFWEPEFEGSDLNMAGWAKKLTGKPTITVGSVGLSGEFVAAYAGETSQPRSIDGLVERLQRGEFDLVAVGRALLGDPAWVDKVRQGRNDLLADFNPKSMETLY